ncbi:MAG: HgcAB-like fusion protein [Candidatus Glassbacteria bacterium]
MKTLTGWFVAYLSRWLPHRAQTGLFPVGKPDEGSPVIVTSNFTLTVKRVRRALEGRNLWLLIADSEGINVWCAAAGGILTENRVIDAVKVSRLYERVSHREIILPPLSAPGVDREAVERKTSFRCRFGPVYARDIPTYLDAGKKKTEKMRRFDFGLGHRIDMFLPMNFPLYLLIAIVVAVVSPGRLSCLTILFWGAVASLYILLDVIPGKTGWGQAMLAALIVDAAWAGIDWYTLGRPFVHAGWLVAVFPIFFVAGFDIAGTLSPRTSDAEEMMRRLGFSRFGSLFSEKETGRVMLDRDRCRGCLTCWDICPIGVYAGLGEDKKVTFRDREACFSCGACVKQCPEGALSLGGGPGRSGGSR